MLHDILMKPNKRYALLTRRNDGDYDTTNDLENGPVASSCINTKQIEPIDHGNSSGTPL